MADYVTARQLAERLGISTRTVQRLAREKKLPHLVIGARYLFDLETVEELATVPAQQQLRPYRKKADYSPQADKELAERLHKAVEAGAVEKPPESILSEEEAIRAHYQGRINRAAHGDEVRLLRLAMARALDELDRRREKEKASQGRVPVDPELCKNPDMSGQ